jgi:hypothetical protein
VTALQAPASSELDVIGEGFTPPTLEKGAIDPDVLGPLEGRASGPRVPSGAVMKRGVRSEVGGGGHRPAT